MIPRVPLLRPAFAPLILAILLALPTALAAAQEPPPPGRGAGPAPDPGLTTRESIQLANALDQFALVQARRALQLDEDQYARFVPRLRALQQARRRNFQARMRLLQDLRRTVGPRAAPADEAAIAGKVQALKEQDERAAREIREATEAIDQVLDPRQQARFRLFEENIEARKLELLLNARARAARGGS